MTLGSLFDGAGTVPFAAQQYGIKTLWSSEIEKFPLQVTAKRFPETKQLGDITKIKGDEIAPVDIIAFGSPCQDLSVAGKQQGLQGERSGLFMEAIRIIKEMRKKTNGKYPTFALWENVCGAFSSNKGEDFRVVLEEFCKIKDETVTIPRPTERGGKWNTVGCIMADGFSLAWRVLDAQYWGVPQRRRRIFLVADFRGECADKVLFERNGLSRSFKESRESWQGFTKTLAFGSSASSESAERGTNGETRSIIGGVTYRKQGHPQNSEQGQGWEETELANCLNIFDMTESRTPIIILPIENHSGDSRMTIGEDGTVQTLTSRIGTGGAIRLLSCGADIRNQNLTGGVSKTLQSSSSDADKVPCLLLALDRAAFNQGQNAKFKAGIDETGEKAFTCMARGPSAIVIATELGKASRIGGGDDYKQVPDASCVGNRQSTPRNSYVGGYVMATGQANAEIVKEKSTTLTTVSEKPIVVYGGVLQ